MTARRRTWLLTAISAGLVLAGAEVVREGVGTLRTLTAVERERDTWQRPDAVIQALDLHPGDTVEDLGSGAGYFALKLARTVGVRGTVLALDLRRESLAFLWIRARREGLRAIRVVRADAGSDAAHGAVLDAVLIANAYHELIQPELVLATAWRSLRPEGRLVVLDKGPNSASDESWRTATEEHEVPLDLVDRAVRGGGFEIISEDRDFIKAAHGVEHWWLIVARKRRLPL